ncbi:MAG: TolC family protein [Firmicutes bacterium]|nr:TolC family protein [Bacillota bacterium]
MKRKLFAVVLCLITACALFTFAGADEAEDTMTLTLQQSVDYALENSAAIKLSHTAVEKAEVGYKEAKSAYDKADKAGGLSREDRMLMSSQMIFENYKMTEGYYKEMADMGRTLAEKGREQTIETVKMAVQSAYFNLLFAQDKAEIQRSILDSAKKDMDIAGKKYELGMVSQVDVLSSEAALESAKLGYNTATRDLEYQRMSFNKTLGLPLKTEVGLTDSLTFEEPPGADIEEEVTLALQNRYEVIAAKEQYRVNELNHKLTLGWYPENTFVTRQARYDMESTHQSLVNAEQDVELSVRKAYMDMQSAYDSIGVLSKNVERLQKAYDIARLRYDTGMATSQEVVNALNALNDIKLQHLQAVHGYNLARIQFEASSGIGIAAAAGGAGVAAPGGF